jgi:hypothetical protein
VAASRAQALPAGVMRAVPEAGSAVPELSTASQPGRLPRSRRQVGQTRPAGLPPTSTCQARDSAWPGPVPALPAFADDGWGDLRVRCPHVAGARGPGLDGSWRGFLDAGVEGGGAGGGVPGAPVAVRGGLARAG